ncbi:MAG: rod shape-determining protein RodA [candidate division WOR-3 bacterium]|nr:rod shape-determining protein RodA [candidate division WOR-3 bacterium]
MNKFRLSPILVISLVLFIIGAVTIYSAVGKTFFLRQIIWFFIALMGLIIAYQIPRRFWENTAIYFYLLMLILLIAVLIIGTGVGSKRWFNLGFINFQPSEFAKLALIIFLAQSWANKPISFRIKDLFLPVVAVITYSALIFLEPDLGTALIFLPILAVMLYWKGLSLFHIFLLFSPILSFIAGFSLYLWIPFFIILLIISYRKTTLFNWLIIIIVNIFAGLLSPIIWMHLKEYQKARILSFLSPWLDPKGMSWNLIQSQIAVGSGRLWGKGFLSGTQKKLAFLPNRHNDFIFSTFAEEFGFFGCILLLLLYFYLIYLLLMTARKTRDDFSSLTAIGLFAVLTYQVLVNIGMALGLLPITGLALPFLSYGGSSLLFYFIAIGIILNIRYKSE